MWTDTIKERAEEKMGRFINLLKCELSIKYITLKKKKRKLIPLPLLPQTQTTEIYLALRSSEQRKVPILPGGIRCKLRPPETSQLETQGVRGKGGVQDEKTPLSDVEHIGLPRRTSGGFAGSFLETRPP